MHICFDWRWWLLEKYNIIQDETSADIKEEFDSKPAYNKIFLKTKTKYHHDEVTDFYDKEIPKLTFCSQKRWELLSAGVFKRV